MRNLWKIRCKTKKSQEKFRCEAQQCINIAVSSICILLFHPRSRSNLRCADSHTRAEHLRSFPESFCSLAVHVTHCWDTKLSSIDGVESHGDQMETIQAASAAPAEERRGEAEIKRSEKNNDRNEILSLYLFFFAKTEITT